MYLLDLNRKFCGIAMNKKALVVAVGCAAFLSATGFANAADERGYYVGLSGIGSYIDDLDGSNSRGGTGKAEHTADFEPSAGAAARLGYRYSEWRAELEFAYRYVEVDSLDSKSNVSGDANVYNFMVNGAYDFDVSETWAPYVLAGVGVLYADGDLKFNDDNGRLQSHSGDGVTVAGQLGIGVSYALSEEVDLVGGYSILGAPTDDAGEDEFLIIHSAQIGMNYKF